MTRKLHQAARLRYTANLDGFFIMRDEQGRTGFTRKHEKGHIIPQAAIANVLQHAAASRHIPSDHAIYIDRVRQLRKRGTWL